MIEGTIDYIFAVIWLTILTLQITDQGNIGVLSCLIGDMHSMNALVNNKQQAIWTQYNEGLYIMNIIFFFIFFFFIFFLKLFVHTR